MAKKKKATVRERAEKYADTTAPDKGAYRQLFRKWCIEDFIAGWKAAHRPKKGTKCPK